MNRILLIIVVCTLSGCRVDSNLKRTMITEPIGFAEYAAEKTERKRYRKIAAEVYETVCNGAEAPKKNTKWKRSPAPYAEGYLDGFVDYMVAGGTVEPPMLPPRKYWNQEHQNVAGHNAAHQWFAGYELGATMARDGGYREATTIPTLPQYYSYLTHEPNFAYHSPFDPKPLHYQNQMMEAPVYFGAMSPNEAIQDSFAPQESLSSNPGEGELFALSVPVPSAPPMVHAAVDSSAGESLAVGLQEKPATTWTPDLVSTPDVLASNVYADDGDDEPSWSQPVVKAAIPPGDESWKPTTASERQAVAVKSMASSQFPVPHPMATPQIPSPEIEASADPSEESRRLNVATAKREKRVASVLAHPVTRTLKQKAIRNRKLPTTPMDPIEAKSIDRDTVTPAGPEARPSASRNAEEQEEPVVKLVLSSPEPPATDVTRAEAKRPVTERNQDSVRDASYARDVRRLPEIETTTFEQSEE